MNFIFLFLFVNLNAALATPLTWEELQTLAAKNTSLQSSAKTVEANKANLKQSYSAFLPQVSLSASQNQDRKMPEASAAVHQKTNTLSATASLNIFKGFSSVASVKSADASLEESKADEILKSAQVRYELRVAFFNVYIQQERIRLYEKVLKRTEQNEKLVGIKYGSGTEAKWNVQVNKAELERARFNLNTAKSDLEQAKIELARVLNTDQIPDRPVATPSDSIFQVNDIAMGDVIQSHPQFLKYSHEEQKFNADRITARAGFLPSVDLSYSRSQSKIEQNPIIYDRAVTLTASWNIFNGFSDFHKVQKANAAHEAAELDKESAQKSLATDLQSKFASLKNSRDRLPVVRSLREASEARLQTVSAQYRTGLKSYLDWEQAENQLIETEQTEISARKEALFALADFERTLGKGLHEK